MNNQTFHWETELPSSQYMYPPHSTLINRKDISLNPLLTTKFTLNYSLLFRASISAAIGGPGTMGGSRRSDFFSCPRTTVVAYSLADIH